MNDFRRRLFSVLCLGGFSAASFAAGNAPSNAPKPAPAVLSPAEMREAAALRDGALQGTGAFAIVKSLTVEVGPRPAGSAGDKAAVAWALAKMKSLGLANVHSEKVMVPHWDRGVGEGWIMTPSRQPVALLALGGSIGTPETGTDAPVVRAESTAALEAMPAADVAGKIVFLDVHMQRTEDMAGYAGAVPARGLGWAAASKKGAVALLLRSIGTDHNRLAHTGGMRADETARPIPAVALSNPDADQLAATLELGKPVSFHLRVSARALPEEESANVIGEVPGSEHPEEIVLLAAHLDSWDPGTGAIDDGAGVAVVLETARRLQALPQAPKRTVRVVLYANEEFGLSGAIAYGEAHKAEFANLVAAAECDSGGDPVFRLTGKVPAAGRPALDTLATLLRPLGVAAATTEGDGGADLIPLAGAPIVAMEQDARNYFDFHHTANDTLDKIDPKNLDRVVAAFSAFAYVATRAPGGFRGAP